MSIRKRPGSWQEEVARGFSRFFSRTSSQEKEDDKKTAISKDSGDEQEKSERGLSRLFSRASSQDKKEGDEKPNSGREPSEEPGKSQGVSGLFSRRLSQDNKGDTDQTPKDEPEKNKVFSRLFTRASSQEKEEESEDTKIKGVSPEASSQEDESTHLTTDNSENASSWEQINGDQNSVPYVQDTTGTEGGNDSDEPGFSEEIKVQDPEKQSRENFLHFIGNLFSFKSSPAHPKQVPINQDLSKENEDAQDKNNFDGETLNEEQTVDVYSGVTQETEDITTSTDLNMGNSYIETPSSSTDIPSSITESVSRSSETPSSITESSARSTETSSNTTESSFGSTETHIGNTETPSEVAERQYEQSPPKKSKKQSSNTLDAPAITYGTYRGSRRIRKLLKRRAEVNSPILEKEENSERETPDIGKTDSTVLPQSDILEKISGLSKNVDQENWPTSQTMLVEVQLHTNENGNSFHTDNLPPDTENSDITEYVQSNAQVDDLTIKDSLIPNETDDSKILEDELISVTTKTGQNLQLRPEEKSTSTDGVESDTNSAIKSTEGWDPHAGEDSKNTDYLETYREQNVIGLDDHRLTVGQIAKSEENLHLLAIENSKIMKDFEPKDENISTDLQSDVEMISDNEEHPPNQNSRLLEKVNTWATENEIYIMDLQQSSETGDLQKCVEDDAVSSGDEQSNIESSIQSTMDFEGSTKLTGDLSTHAVEISKIAADQRTENAKPGVDFQRHTKPTPTWDIQRHLEESAKDLEDHEANEEQSLKSAQDRQLYAKDKSFKQQIIIGVYSHSCTTEISTSERNCPPNVGENTEYAGNIQLFPEEIAEDQHPGADNVSIRAGEVSTTCDVQPYVNKISQDTEDLQPYVKEMLNTDMLEHPLIHVNFSTKDNLQRNFEEISTSLDDSYPYKESTENNVQDVLLDAETGHLPTVLTNEHTALINSSFTCQSASEQFDEKEDGGFLQTLVQLQPEEDSNMYNTYSGEDYAKCIDTKYNELEFTSGTEADKSAIIGTIPQNLDRSVLHNNNYDSVSIVSSTPENMQNNQIYAMPSSFQEDTNESDHKFTNASGSSLPHLDSISDICSSPVSMGVTTDVETVGNNDFNNICSSSSLSKYYSPTKETLALSFDNSVDIPSSLPTTSSESPLSPAACVGLRDDSPLPYEDGIDSGIVSSQAYTPEENIMAISPDMYSSIKCDTPEISIKQEKSTLDSLELDKEKPVDCLFTPSGLDNTKQLNILPTLRQETLPDMEERSEFSDSSFTDVTSAVKYPEYDKAVAIPSFPFYSGDDSKPNFNKEGIYVAKVLVKSVDVEEVKVSPYSLTSEVITVSKLESPKFEPEYICLPNTSPPPEASTPIHDFQAPVHYQAMEYNTIVKNIFSEKEEIQNYPTMNFQNGPIPEKMEQGMQVQKSDDGQLNNSLVTFKLNKIQSEDDDQFHHDVIDKAAPDLEISNSASKRKDIPLDIGKMLPNVYKSDISDPNALYEFPIMSDKSSDERRENLKNNNFVPPVKSVQDNCVSLPARKHKPLNEKADDISIPSVSQEESENLDLYRNFPDFEPNLKVIHAEPRNSDDALHTSSLQDGSSPISPAHSPKDIAVVFPKPYILKPSNNIEETNEKIFTSIYTDTKESPLANNVNICQTNNNQNIITPNAVGLNYSESKDPYGSIAAEIVNDVMVSVAQFLVPNKQQSELNLSDDKIPYSSLNNTNADILDRKYDGISQSPNSIRQLSSLELHNANNIPSGEINANILLPMDMPQNTSLTTQKRDLESCPAIVSDDQGHINEGPLTGSLNNNLSTGMIPNEHIDTHWESNLEEKDIPQDSDDENISFIENDIYDKSIEYLSDLSQTTSRDIELIGDDSSDVREEHNLSPSETKSDYNDAFSLYNGYYVEIGESDEETADGENYVDGTSEEEHTDALQSTQIRRVPFYPFSLSPIYEDDSSSEDVLSNHTSPRPAQGKDENTNSNDHTSILSLLQSVSDRLKQENVLSLDNNKPYVNADLNQTGMETTEKAISPSSTDANILNDKQEKPTDSSQISQRHGLFITKSIIDNRPALGLGRKSFLLNMSSETASYGSKSNGETISELGSKTSVLEEPTPTVAESDSSVDSASNSAPVKAPSMLPMATKSDFSFQTSDIEPKSRLSSRSVYYQYFSDANSYSDSTENKTSHPQRKNSSQENSPQKAEIPVMSLSNPDTIKPNQRPGKVVISDIIEHERRIDLYEDILDATTAVFPNGVNIRVIRGCWILYEKPHFQGQAHVLEEGEAVLQSLWGSPGAKSKPEEIIIGSVKRVAKDYFPEIVLSRLFGTTGVPIHLHTEVPFLKKQVDSIPRSLEVMSGVWLAYTDAQFNGNVSVLEEGSVLSPVHESGIQSLRPLKLGGLKVEQPSQPKVIVYQKPNFEGWSRELTDHVYSIKTMICEGEDQKIGSMRVIGGIWVGYEKERYKGMQYLLEEGEYEDWNSWGGFSDALQSLRYLHADFLETSVTLFESEAEDQKSIDLFNQAVSDLELSGYSRETQCIHVKKGIWVAYQQKYFCGEQYILEKGRYKSCVDWGGNTNTIMSIRPVMLEALGKDDPKHWIKAFSCENFQGQCEDFSMETSDFTTFAPRSFKVLRGCWLLFYQIDSRENLCVLEEGHFPDLAMCDCPTAVIHYIKPVDYVFAEPAISLFALDLCEGRELHFEEPVTSVLSKDLNFYTQSVWVRRGLWIAFEGANFLGRQMLLDAGQILNWTEFSGWKAIGSLRPLKQTPVYFRIRNRHNDKYLTVTGTLTDTRTTFACASSRNGQNTQIWYFCRGLLKSKANDSCLDIIGGKNLPGSKVSLWAEHGKSRQKWSINKDGTITSYISDDLVLDLKGGNYYDQNYIVVNRAQQDIVTQKWDIEIL
ncbi:very large A-kinase anchor protein [Pelobates fuscus]|uniref:very large A-kinase anchor protein n=1 Tax=Pelobates fuscus TaxID=191477 RepID=UPI002FE4E4A6